MIRARNLAVLTAVALFLSLAAISSAEFVSLTEAITLPLSQGESLIVGDKQFSNFLMRSRGLGGAWSPTPETVEIVGGYDDVTGDIGLWFITTGWTAGPNQFMNVTLTFDVAVIEGANQLIKDVSMVLAGASATDTALSAVGEYVYDPSDVTKTLASLSLAKYENDGDRRLTAHKDLLYAVPAISVYKDFSLSGGADGVAHISGFFQYYSQVPEPTSLGLLAAGVIGLLRKRRR